MNPLETDIHYMQQALVCAEHAEKSGEIPIGAVMVVDQQLISTAYNQTISNCDPTAHAEILVLQKTAKMTNNHRLLGATLYVSLEPCLMCVGAMIQARIKRLVFGAYANRCGAIASLQLLQSKGLNHSFAITDGILAHRCAEKLQQFFLKKRHKV